MLQRGVLLVNLGSPDSPSVKDVRKYLHQFLMDERVIDAPYLVRKMIVSFFILPNRPRQSAIAYRSIWWDEGSPLVVISQKVQQLLQVKVDLPVELAMRYGNPSIKHGIQQLLQKQNPKIEEIFLVPFYPHYAMSTFESVVIEVKKTLSKLKTNVKLTIMPPFYDNIDYIETLVESARKYLEQDFDYLLFSYHGLPERHIKKTDSTGEHCLKDKNCCDISSEAHKTCYRHQVFETTRLFAEKMSLPKEKYSVSFQSRLGSDPWLKPYTTDELRRLATSGVKKLVVVCPAFVSDCLETIEEIGIVGKKSFLAAGGKDFQLIPCLNDHPAWINVLQKWCEKVN